MVLHLIQTLKQGMHILKKWAILFRIMQMKAQCNTCNDCCKLMGFYKPLKFCRSDCPNHHVHADVDNSINFKTETFLIVI